ncbi:hypothetical protein QBC41DRAFT_306009 [Cercophora samala]|uniref:Heterokaryon incompatibility domain-containing protein n=1 Tax=Cercophora samala TaxID=330535 RepID=A0AA39Z7A1_9PEZI|nr:hypothetical protein QBC41DRAFT_306009 [Cercophora samala]
MAVDLDKIKRSFFERVQEEFFRYVQNEIPIRLIYVKEMRLVDRAFIQQHYLSRIEMMENDNITKEFIEYTSKNTVRMQGLVRKVVKYGILSHRWLPEGEPTVEEMLNGTTADTPGYRKLRKLCEVAGREFVWSDTCCIDKRSSSELDESIRSMYKWYRNSAVCVVYLAQTVRLEDMAKDEWFRRGWTLQELLAPAVVKFYDRNWRPLVKDAVNDKDERRILQPLVSATGCPEHDLRRFSPGPYAVDERMSWAARRVTTRAEDMAYSLMGIFDVTIQPAYGEGGERAFCRLVEAIMISGGSSSVLNWAGMAAESHNSNALPSSPSCYARQPQQTGKSTTGWLQSTEGLDMAMTSRGLRLKLLILPMIITKHTMDSSSCQLTLSATVQPFDRDVGNITVRVLGLRELANFELALGVFNYVPEDELGHPALRHISAAYLLCKKTPITHQLQQVSVSEGRSVIAQTTKLTEYGWNKLSTSKAIHFTLRSVDPDHGAMLVDKSRLVMVYI